MHDIERSDSPARTRHSARRALRRRLSDSPVFLVSCPRAPDRSLASECGQRASRSCPGQRWDTRGLGLGAGARIDVEAVDAVERGEPVARIQEKVSQRPVSRVRAPRLDRLDDDDDRSKRRPSPKTARTSRSAPSTSTLRKWIVRSAACSRRIASRRVGTAVCSMRSIACGKLSWTDGSSVDGLGRDTSGRRHRPSVSPPIATRRFTSRGRASLSGSKHGLGSTLIPDHPRS